jgi:hypothetical protein
MCKPITRHHLKEDFIMIDIDKIEAAQAEADRQFENFMNSQQDDNESDDEELLSFPEFRDVLSRG